MLRIHMLLKMGDASQDFIDWHWLFDAHLRQAVTEGISGQTEESGGVALVAVGAFQGFADERWFEVTGVHSVGEKIIPECGEARERWAVSMRTSLASTRGPC